ncbi:MAG TPA: hypothetical protein VJP88_04135 [Caulobacteraceae bacterium]|nr:hypothetical protein [Caulobacteraceae bacterium]
MSEIIADAYSPIRLAEQHDDLARKVQEMTRAAMAITGVNSEDDNTSAAAMVISLRALASKVDKTADETKEPVYRAYQNVLDFFGGLNRTTGKVGPLTREKVRLEKAIRDHGFRVAEEARQKRLAEEAAERERARLEAEAAAAAEAANKPAVAQVLIDQAVKSENIANAHAEVARGPIQDLARTRTESATTGLRAVPGFEVVDPAALRASLGPLGQYLSADHIGMAIRKYRAEGEQFGKWPFRDDDQHAQRRAVKPPREVPGVEYFVSYEGSVRN